MCSIKYNVLNRSAAKWHLVYQRIYKVCCVHLCVFHVDVCVCNRFGAPCVALVMRALTALTRSGRKVCEGFFFSLCFCEIE